MLVIMCQKTKHSQAVTVGDYSDACRAAVNICHRDLAQVSLEHMMLAPPWCCKHQGETLFSIVLPALASCVLASISQL